jgi:hypothetical protein
VPLTGHPVTIQVGSVAAIWAVEGALLVGILCVLAFAFKPVMAKFADGTTTHKPSSTRSRDN